MNVAGVTCRLWCWLWCWLRWGRGAVAPGRAAAAGRGGGGRGPCIRRAMPNPTSRERLPAKTQNPKLKKKPCLESHRFSRTKDVGVLLTLRGAQGWQESPPPPASAVAAAGTAYRQPPHHQQTAWAKVKAANAIPASAPAPVTFGFAHWRSEPLLGSVPGVSWS